MRAEGRGRGGAEGWRLRLTRSAEAQGDGDLSHRHCNNGCGDGGVGRRGVLGTPNKSSSDILRYSEVKRNDLPGVFRGEEVRFNIDDQRKATTDAMSNHFVLLNLVDEDAMVDELTQPPEPRPPRAVSNILVLASELPGAMEAMCKGMRLGSMSNPQTESCSFWAPELAANSAQRRAQLCEATEPAEGGGEEIDDSNCSILSTASTESDDEVNAAPIMHTDDNALSVDEEACLEQILRSFFAIYAPGRIDEAKALAASNVDRLAALNENLNAEYNADLLTPTFLQSLSLSHNEVSHVICGEAMEVALLEEMDCALAPVVDLSAPTFEVAPAEHEDGTAQTAGAGEHRVEASCLIFAATDVCQSTSAATETAEAFEGSSVRPHHKFVYDDDADIKVATAAERMKEAVGDHNGRAEALLDMASRPQDCEVPSEPLACGREDALNSDSPWRHSTSSTEQACDRFHEQDAEAALAGRIPEEPPAVFASSSEGPAVYPKPEAKVCRPGPTVSANMTEPRECMVSSATVDPGLSLRALQPPRICLGQNDLGECLVNGATCMLFRLAACPRS